MEFASDLTFAVGGGTFGEPLQAISEVALTDINACEDDDAGVAAFGGCAGAVAALNCNFVFDGFLISELCPVTCNVCP